MKSYKEYLDERRHRYATDPAFREQQKRRATEQYEMHRLEPEFKAKRAARQKARLPQHRIETKNYRDRLRLKVITHYSPDKICRRCGFDDFRALTIDHIDAGGKNKAGYGQHLYNYIVRNGYPAGFQVLCMNCQWIKRSENNECAFKREQP